MKRSAQYAHFVFPQNDKSKADLIDTLWYFSLIVKMSVRFCHRTFFASLFPIWYSEDISKYPVTETFCCCSSSHWSNLGCSKTSVIGREAYQGGLIPTTFNIGLSYINNLPLSSSSCNIWLPVTTSLEVGAFILIWVSESAYKKYSRSNNLFSRTNERNLKRYIYAQWGGGGTYTQTLITTLHRISHQIDWK